MIKRAQENRVVAFAVELTKRIMKNDITGFSAQIAYFFLLSLFPLLIVFVSLIPFLPITQADMIGLFEGFAPDETIYMIESVLKEVVVNGSGGLLSAGIIGTMWSASNGMNAVMRALNRAYGADENRPFIIARSLSVILTLAMIVVVLIMLILPVFGQQIGVYLFSNLGFSEEFVRFWNSLRWVASPIVLFIVFLGIYFFAPTEKVKWREILPGAVFATVGWIIVSIGFSYYVSNFSNFSATYGSIGGIIVLMLWFYLTGMILMIGGEINALLVVKKDAAITVVK